MPQFYMQVAIVKEHVVEASDELQAERAVFAAEKDRDNIVGMKCYGLADDTDNQGALSGDPIADMKELRKFNAIDPEWCNREAQ